MRPLACVIAIAMLLGITVAAGIEYAYAPTVIAQGFFHSVAHKGSGNASLFRDTGGNLALRIANLHTAMRPDLVVYLVSARDAFDNETVTSSRVVSLGNLRGGAENRVYPLPLGVDPSQFHSVTIWSRQYHVNFTTAPLRSVRE